MKISNIKEAEREAIKFLNRLREVKESATNSKAFESNSGCSHTYTSKETGALKRSSMDLTRSLSKMRNDNY